MYTKFYFIFLFTIILISSCNENSEEIVQTNTPVLKVSVNELDFQNDKTTLYFNVENIGEGTLYWEIIEEIDWIITDKKGGAITKLTDTLAVTVYRAGIPKGEIQEIISIKSNGGLHEIIVKLEIHEEVVMSGSFIDSRDDNTYNWVQIGNQTWMAENLAFKPEKGSFSFNYDEQFVKEFGRLYNMDVLNEVCPEGWRIPTELEWEELMYYINDQKGPYNIWGGIYLAGIGDHLKSTSGWTWNGTDDYNFCAVPNGRFEIEYGFLHKDSGYWWSSTNRSGWGRNNTIFAISGRQNSPLLAYQTDSKECYISIRCIKD